MIELEFSLKELVSFVGIVTLLVMMPGPNTLLITQSVSLYGKKAGFYNIAGFISGLYIHALTFSVGLSLIILKSTKVFMTIKLFGAIYIIFLGVISLYKGYKLSNNTYKNSNSNRSINYKTESAMASYFKGLISCVLNPKAALFFVSFFPQFIHNEKLLLVESLFLTMIYTFISLSWYSALIFFIDKYKALIESNRIKQSITLITGILFITLGLKLATQNK